MQQQQKLIFEKSVSGRRCTQLPACDIENKTALPQDLLREEAPLLPEIAEVDLVRHYMALSRKAHGVDNGFYPLGSCTMKYNPRLNEEVAAMPGFTDIHPLQPTASVQGALKVMQLLQQYLAEITGMDAVTLQPAAGAQGEWTGLLLIKAYHEAHGEQNRTKILIPDSAHGTNPASAAMCGFQVVHVPCTEDGFVDVAALRSLAGPDTAGLMLTNPNTLGLFEKDSLEMADIIHKAGGLLYYDGANLNAIMGIARPGDLGFDVCHLNLHKTFSTPHGGGGPGSGPVGCKKALSPYLPNPIVEDENGQLTLNFDNPNSIGQVKAFYGNFLVYLKAFTYILSSGADGLKQASQGAVLNANYMLYQLKEIFHLNNTFPCMHEFVLSMEDLKEETGVSAMDVAKALLDYGIHPPTMYFPLIVPEALMVEPTETENKETLDFAIETFRKIKEEAFADSAKLHQYPLQTPVRRLDEVQAARKPILKYQKSENQ